VLAAQRREAAALLLAGLFASMSILWSDSRSSGCFEATQSVLGIGISASNRQYVSYYLCDCSKMG
jgi:hypothetical protein